MKKYIKDFLFRGAVFAGLGPIVLAVVYKVNETCGVAASVSSSEACLGIVSTYLLAFVVAGMSVLYNIERLPLLASTFLHASALFVSYVTVYLLNGWIKPGHIWIFVLIFIGVYAVIWLTVLICINASVKKVNRGIRK